MANKQRRWSLEEIEELRQAARADFEGTAERENLSLEELQGLTSVKVPRKLLALRAIRPLALADKSTRQIAQATGFSERYVNLLIQQHNLRKERYPREYIIDCGIKWFERYGTLPTAPDWNPKLKRVVEEEPQRAKRFYQFEAEFDCPRTSTVQRRFGSWSNFVNELKKRLQRRLPG